MPRENAIELEIVEDSQMQGNHHRARQNNWQQDSDWERYSRANVENSIGRRKGGPWKAVFVIALIVLVGSLGTLGVIGFSYFQGQQKYQNVSQLANVGEGTVLPSSAGAEIEPDKLSVDWEALRAANPDTVAWVYIPGTSISYPVVRGTDNEFYLTHDFDGEAGWLANYGAIFMDYRNKPNWSDQCYFIYGHHMNDGSMFAGIVGFEDQARFDECRSVYLLSPSGNFKLRTFSLIHCSADEEFVISRFDDKAKMNEYVANVISRSVVEALDCPPVDSINKVFAFATCDNESWGRYVLYAYVEGSSDGGLTGTIELDLSEGSPTGIKETLDVTDKSA